MRNIVTIEVEIPTMIATSLTTASAGAPLFTSLPPLREDSPPLVCSELGPGIEFQYLLAVLADG